jgi:Leucine-rich repeat (LRR) protein
MQKFENMKVLTLNFCKYLTNIPDVSHLPNLEKFSFEYCDNLITIHSSIGYLNKLEVLNAKGCRKLKNFPPLRLTSLKELELRECESLKKFPELLGKMTNIQEIRLSETSIRELPFSFQNLSELRNLTLYEGGMLRFSSNIFMMPNLSMIYATDCRLLLPKDKDILSSTVASNVEQLILINNNLSDECVRVVLTLCANVTYLNLSDNSIKVIPECLSFLRLEDCKSLEEIRGIPPNLKRFSAMRRESLTSSCRRMLLSQVCCFFSTSI